MATPKVKPEPVEETTLSCPECDATFTGPVKGYGSATFKLGSHRYREHDVRSDSPKGKKKPPRTADEGAVSAVIRDIGSGVRDGSSRQGVPTAAELSTGLGRALQTVTIVAASYMAETDDRITTEAARVRLVTDLSLTKTGAQDLMEPIAKAFAPTRVNKSYGRAIVDNTDAIASVGELVKIGMHWRRYLKSRAADQPVPLADGSTYIPPGSPQAPPPGTSPTIEVQPTAQAPQPATPAQGAPEVVVPSVPAPNPNAPGFTAPTSVPDNVPPVSAQAYDLAGNPVAPSTGALVDAEMVRRMRAGG